MIRTLRAAMHVRAPSAKVFFEEVRLAHSGVSTRLGFVGPEETLDVVPTATYRSQGLT